MYLKKIKRLGMERFVKSALFEKKKNIFLDMNEAYQK